MHLRAVAAAACLLVTIGLLASPARGASGPAVGVDIELTPDGQGYWALDSYGRVSAFGSAVYLGGSPPLESDEEAVSIAPTASGAGYWIFTSKGRVFTFGDAVFYGDIPQVLPGVGLNGSILDTAVTASGMGYYMLGSDGGIFAFGDAGFFGSIQQYINDNVQFGLPAAQWLAGPIVSMAPTASGLGYWLVADDGGMFSFGDAAFFGSVPQVLPGVRLNRPVVGMVPQGAGYLLVAEDGGIFNFGNSLFHGSIPGLVAAEAQAAVVLPAGGEIAAVMVTPDRLGYSMLGRNGIVWPFGSLFSLGAVDVTTPANPGDAYNCTDFPTVDRAQDWFDRFLPFYGDIAGLDADDDRLACEGLPTEVTFGAGTYIVGTDVTASTYRTRTNGAGCFYERLSGFGGSPGETIDSEFTDNAAVVTIDPTDAGFRTDSDCGTWTTDLSAITSSPTADFSGGTYIVGTDLATGRWRSRSVSPFCSWQRLSGFSGEFSDIITSEFTDVTTIVDIADTDTGFATDNDCGTWTRDLSAITSSPTADFSGGTYIVGTDLASGRWRSGPVSGFCSWRRLSGFSGEFGDIIASEFTDVTTIVEIADTDTGFITDNDCGTWTRDLSPITGSPVAPFTGGTYIVGVDIAPGRWQSTGGTGCAWQRLSGFGGEFSDIIASDFTNASTIVDIADTDTGFTTDNDCGTWTKIG